MNKETKGTYRGKPVEEMDKEELIEALENISNLFQQVLLRRLK